jgi:hypothetical protein
VRVRSFSRWFGLLAFVWTLGSLATEVHAQAKPPVDSRFEKFFWHYVDQRSLPERALNAVGTTVQDVGRSFALITGVYEYPKMGETLPPAHTDMTKLTHYLKTQEFFDEIVVLANQDFTLENLVYFLQVYFPQRLAKFPKSRFLFAFSGHGINDAQRGYLLYSNAERLDDKANAINLRVLRELFQEVVDRGFHVLALINACYGGNFFSRSFGEERRYLPSHPGAHAITAGRANELVYADPALGPGSAFFETFFAALDQRADTFPMQRDESRGDGVITFDELATWLKHEVQFSSREHVNPQAGDLAPFGSAGGFFFFNRQRQVARGMVPKWEPATLVPFGAPVALQPIMGSNDTPRSTYTDPSCLVLFGDDFNDGIGDGWTSSIGGGFGTEDGQLISHSYRETLWLGERDWTDVAVEVDVKEAGCGDDYVAILLRMQDTSNYIGVVSTTESCDSPTGGIFLMRNGQKTTMFNKRGSPGHWRIEAVGKHYRVFVDGQPLMSAYDSADNAFTRGSVGISMGSGKLDNFTVCLYSR